jgi:hypothetical protein
VEKLKEKIGEPTIREQLKICVNAWADHKQMYDSFLHLRTPESEERTSKAEWWASESREKLCALLWNHTYHGMSYAYWYFKDEIDDAWMDSDDDLDLDEACQAEAWRQQEEQMNEQQAWNEQTLE